MGIKIEYLGKRKWKLLEDLEYSGGTIEAGFIFDGASAPRLFWNIIPPIQETARASCIHDFLSKRAKDPLERYEADLEFYKELREGLVKDVEITRFMDRTSGEVRSFLGFLGVRIGAWWGTGVTYKHWRINNGV